MGANDVDGLVTRLSVFSSAGYRRRPTPIATAPITRPRSRMSSITSASAPLRTRTGTTTPSTAGLSDALASYWVAFAQTGDPNGWGTRHWPAYDRDADVALVLGDTVEARPNIRQERLDVFDEYYAARREAAKE